VLPGELQPGDTRGANRLRFARRVRIAIRGASLRAGMSEYLVNQIEATADIECSPAPRSSAVVGGDASSSSCSATSPRVGDARGVGRR